MKLPMIFLVNIAFCSSLHLKGTWQSKYGYHFLTKFAFQQTNMNSINDTQGYIYGNITSSHYSNTTLPIFLVLVDSEYFLDLYHNQPQDETTNEVCHKMFEKIERIAWHVDCNPKGKQDFLRSVPCRKGTLCPDEDEPARVMPQSQFTYSVQDLQQPRFWYLSLTSCTKMKAENGSCAWKATALPNQEIVYDIWLVNGSPNLMYFNIFEHQFSFEIHDVFELYAAFLLGYVILVSLQFYSCHQQSHRLPLLLFICMIFEFCGVIGNFSHYLLLALNGQGIPILHVLGNFIDLAAQCLFMLNLLLLAKGWTVTRSHLEIREQFSLFSIWTTYTAANIALFIWDLMERDILSDVDEWETLPGFFILGFRILIMGWFLFELRKTAAEEGSLVKRHFYLHLGAGFLVWFVYLPIIAAIGTQISLLWRHKTILSVMYSADFLSYAVMVHLLWPSRSAMYFNLNSKTLVSIQEFSSADLSIMDSESDDSIDIHEMAVLVKRHKDDYSHKNGILRSSKKFGVLSNSNDESEHIDE